MKTKKEELSELRISLRGYELLIVDSQEEVEILNKEIYKMIDQKWKIQNKISILTKVEKK